MTWISNKYQGKWSELDDFYQDFNKLNKMTNQTNATDITFMSLAMADFGGAASTLANHDYYVAAGLVVLGVVLVYLYHKYGSTTAN